MSSWNLRNVTLFENRVVTEFVKMRSWWVRVGPGVFVKKREIWTDTQVHVMMEAQMGWCAYKPRDAKDCQ